MACTAGAALRTSCTDVLLPLLELHKLGFYTMQLWALFCSQLPIPLHSPLLLVPLPKQVHLCSTLKVLQMPVALLVLLQLLPARFYAAVAAIAGALMQLLVLLHKINHSAATPVLEEYSTLCNRCL